MKNLSLFLTLSLLTLMGTCTIVKANPAEDNLEQYQNSVILSQAEDSEMPGEKPEMSLEDSEMSVEETEMSVEESEMPTVEEVKMPVEDSQVPVDKN